MSADLIVGIDPGVHTGFAQWDRKAKCFIAVLSMPAALALWRVQEMKKADLVHMVVFEDARLRTGYFGPRAAHNAQGAGSIKRDCQLWAEWLGLLELPYRTVSPKHKGKKMGADAFARLTGWQGRTNEHARDAAALVWGMN
jgi:hypothetical protein